MTYDPRNALTGMTRYSDVAGTNVVGLTSYTYDGQGRVTQILSQSASLTPQSNITYTYDLANRVTTETANSVTTTYSYDNANQLTADSTTTYTYDANGNRTNHGDTIGPNNQLLSDGVWNYTYDNEGNLVQKVGISNGLTWTYTYDNLNRLVSAVEMGAASAAVTYVYDVFGNRIEEDAVNGVGPVSVTRFAYDGSNAFADLDGSNNLVTRRLYLDAVDALVARIGTGNAVAWYLTDRLGSVRALADNTGAVIDKITYDGFGNVLTETNPAASDRYKFTGREFDATTGLQYNRARFYDPATGRWDSQDPLGFDGGDANLYRYVRNNPTNDTDPGGLACVCMAADEKEKLDPAAVKQLIDDLSNEDKAAFASLKLVLLARKDAAKLVGIVTDRFKVKQPAAADVKAAAAKVAGLLNDLDSDKFATRQKAQEEIEKLGPAALPALQKALGGKPSLEVKQRLESAIATIKKQVGSELSKEEKQRLVNVVAGVLPDVYAEAPDKVKAQIKKLLEQYRDAGGIYEAAARHGLESIRKAENPCP